MEPHVKRQQLCNQSFLVGIDIKWGAFECWSIDPRTIDLPFTKDHSLTLCAILLNCLESYVPSLPKLVYVQSRFGVYINHCVYLLIYSFNFQVPDISYTAVMHVINQNKASWDELKNKNMFFCHISHFWVYVKNIVFEVETALMLERPLAGKLQAPCFILTPSHIVVKLKNSVSTVEIVSIGQDKWLNNSFTVIIRLQYVWILPSLNLKRLK